MINNYEGAIDCAIKANRIFEAFMIAYAHPYDREKYFEYLIERFSIENKNSFLQNFLNPLTHKDYSSIIDSYDTNEWKDILTFIVKNIESKHEREGYYQKLIDKLNKESDKRSAVLYINLFCNNFDSFINILLEENSNNNTDYTLLLKNFQLLYLLKLKNKLEIRNNTLQQQLLKLCNALIDKQFVRLAYELLEVLGDSKDDRINLYQNELYRAYSAELNLFYAQPAALKLFNFNFPKAKTAPVKSDKNKFGPKKTNPFNPTKPGIKRTSDRKPVNIFGNKPTINKPLVKNPGDTKKRKVIAPPKPKLQQKEQPLSPPIPAKPTFKPGFQKNPITTMTAKPMPPKTTKFAPKPPAPVNPHNSFKPQESNPLGIQNPKTPMVKPPPPTIKKPMIQNKVVKPVKPPVKKMAPAPPTNPLPQTMQSTMPPKPSTIRTGVKPALSKPPQKKVAPPPPMQKKTPNPMPREVFVPDQAMVEEINGFIAKTPDFISSIEPDHFKANQMKTSLNQLNSMISNGSIDENTFNEIYEVVNSISENDMNRANAILKSLSLKANSKLKPVIGTFQAFVDALS